MPTAIENQSLPFVSSNPILSILIPTYNRPLRIARQLDYLQFVLNPSKAVVKSTATLPIEILIADGTSDPKLRSSENERRAKALGIVYEHMETSLPERYRWLTNRAAGEFSVALGDDDLLLFDSIAELLKQFDIDENLSCVAGRLVNIYGMSGFTPGTRKLKLSTKERPYAGLSINAPDALNRIYSYMTLNCVGIPALAYSLQPTSVIRDFWNSVPELSFLGAYEFVHQLATLSKGNVRLDSRPLFLRDFIYSDYAWSPEREAPETDPVPYLGARNLPLIKDFLSEKYGLEGKSIEGFFEFKNVALKEFWEVCARNPAVSSNLLNVDLKNYGESIKWATKAWSKNYVATNPNMMLFPRIERKIRAKLGHLLKFKRPRGLLDSPAKEN